ncbi:hypothetical protein T03_3495 [Trichinella britovi]|uniref:Uncharacterized protein n=1 Tax=Trichinella britovi TaxID=45882 RepID=A0A0V1CKV0_TRIBR|nr:hypothetical protein T03_3495 [Trichinella britovi]
MKFCNFREKFFSPEIKTIGMGIIENYHIRKLFSCKIPLLPFYKFQRVDPDYTSKACRFTLLLVILNLEVIDAISKEDQVDSPFH